MYSNSDMVYFDDLLLALRHVAHHHSDFVMVGQRRDLSHPRLIDFDDPAWRADLRLTALKYAPLHGRFGIDYFIQRTAHVRALPPFVVGRIRWDNWLLAEYIRNKTSVAVDCTDVILAVHLNHMAAGGSHRRVGTDYNIQLVAGEPVDPKKIGDISSCDVRLVGLKNGGKSVGKSVGKDEISGKTFEKDTNYVKKDTFYMENDQFSPSKTGSSCPHCTFERVQQSLDVSLHQQADYVTRNIIIASVNSGYLDFALNWMCSLQRIGMDNFLFHAIDMDIYETLHGMGLPVVYYESAMAEEFKAKKGKVGYERGKEGKGKGKKGRKEKYI